MTDDFQENDKYFAHMALHIVDGLKASARRVGFALVDCYNTRTRQCDPSIGKLALSLGIDRSTVIRATQELVDAGLFKKIIHGGYFHRNFYRPCWNRFREIVGDWNRRWRRKSGGSSSNNPVANHRPCQSQSPDLGGGADTTQTEGSNRRNETDSEARREQKPESGRVPGQVCKRGRTLGNKSGKGARRTPGMPGTKTGGSDRASAARERAIDRIDKDLRRHLTSDQYTQIVSEMPEEVHKRAVEAEVKRHHSGYPLVLRAAANGWNS